MMPGVGGDEQDRRRQQADVDLGRLLQEAEVDVLDHAEHRVAGVAALAPRAGRAASGTCRPRPVHRQRRQRDGGQQRVDREHRDHARALIAAGIVLRLVLGLLGHVRDRLDPGVGDHADRDREEEVLPRRRDARGGRCRSASGARSTRNSADQRPAAPGSGSRRPPARC